MGKLRITAAKTLEFGFASRSIEEMRADLRKIVARRREAQEIRNAVHAALRSLPEIPETELNPITESH
jgi:hypothetical protein